MSASMSLEVALHGRQGDITRAPGVGGAWSARADLPHATPPGHPGIQPVSQGHSTATSLRCGQHGGGFCGQLSCRDTNQATGKQLTAALHATHLQALPQYACARSSGASSHYHSRVTQHVVGRRVRDARGCQVRPQEGAGSSREQKAHSAWMHWMGSVLSWLQHAAGNKARATKCKSIC